MLQKEVINLNPNVDRAIIRFVEKQVPELLQRFEDIIKFLDGIETSLDKIADILDKMD